MPLLDGLYLRRNLQRVGQVERDGLGATASLGNLAGHSLEFFLAARCK
jgi:hypothetical protein